MPLLIERNKSFNMKQNRNTTAKNTSDRSTLDKALRINLDDKKYGTIVEIGAGQEVARQFFKTGAAAGPIAKTMSAYDMKFSDAIYGVLEDGRYVANRGEIQSEHYLRGIRAPHHEVIHFR